MGLLGLPDEVLAVAGRWLERQVQTTMPSVDLVEEVGAENLDMAGRAAMVTFFSMWPDHLLEALAAAVPMGTAKPPKSVYIATRLRYAEVQQQLAAELDDWRQTHDWTQHPWIDDPQGAPVEALPGAAAAEIQAVAEAFAVVVLALDPERGTGSHVELGAALALGKPVVLFIADGASGFLTEPHRCVFHHHPQVWLVEGGDPLVEVPVALDELYEEATSGPA